VCVSFFSSESCVCENCTLDQVSLVLHHLQNFLDASSGCDPMSGNDICLSQQQKKIICIAVVKNSLGGVCGTQFLRPDATKTSVDGLLSSLAG